MKVFGRNLRWPRQRDFAKFFHSVVGLPWIHVEIEPMADGRSRLEIDYNMAFVKYLDKNGFDEHADDDDKVDAYVRKVVASTSVAEDVDEDEDDEG